MPTANPLPWPLSPFFIRCTYGLTCICKHVLMPCSLTGLPSLYTTLQVANQPAMEAVPLILEPESRFYTDPVLVLDFQSLYPSIIIAYNLCYSTVVGRPAHAAAAGQQVKLGAANYAVPPGTLTGLNAPDK